MRLFFYALVFSLAASVSAFSAPPVGGVQPTITVGGRVFTDLARLKILRCFASSDGSNNNCTFRDTAAPAGGYVVPASKTLRVQAYRMTTMIAGAGVFASLMYSNNDVGANSATAPTSPVYLMGGTITASSIVGSALAGGVVEGLLNFTVPTTKFVTTLSQGSVSTSYTIDIFGYEQ